MIDETIQRIEARLRSAEAMPEQTRAELLNLLGALKAEVGQLPATKSEQARNIARYADLSTEQAVASERDAEQFKGTLDGLAGSVREFEETHPRLVQTVNNIAHALSGLGI
jgi:hypothetical protein